MSRAFSDLPDYPLRQALHTWNEGLIMAFDTLEQTSEEMDDRVRELLSLARLVTYARNSAKDLKVEFPTYCLDLALGSLIEEISKCGVGDIEGADHEDHAPSFISGVSH